LSWAFLIPEELSHARCVGSVVHAVGGTPPLAAAAWPPADGAAPWPPLPRRPSSGWTCGSCTGRCSVRGRGCLRRRRRWRRSAPTARPCTLPVALSFCFVAHVGLRLMGCVPFSALFSLVMVRCFTGQRLTCCSPCAVCPTRALLASASSLHAVYASCRRGPSQA